MVDPTIIGSDFRISLSEDLGHFEPLRPLSERALEQGYTELRFNPDTMGWAYNQPDQAVGDDGRVYVKKPEA